MNGLDELIQARKAGISQRLALEDAEPDLHLVQPTGAGGCEVEGDVGVSGEPLVVLLVRIEVVQDDVDFAVGGFVNDDLLQESLEIDALLGLGGLAVNDAGGHFEGGEQVNRAMAFVSAFESLDHLPATGLDVAAPALQRLDRGLLVDAQDEGLFRRV